MAEFEYRYGKNVVFLNTVPKYVLEKSESIEHGGKMQNFWHHFRHFHAGNGKFQVNR